MKMFGAPKSSYWASNGSDCACVRLFGVVGSCHRHPVHLQLRKGWSISDPSIIFGLRIAPNPCRPRPLATKKVFLETVLEEASSGEPKNAASKFFWIGLPALALSLSAVFGGQSAYAEVKPNVVAEVGVQMEVVMDSAPSVEAILAKQLARRFREMTDEELVNILQQLLKASRSSLSSQNAVDDGILPEDLVIQNEKRQIETKIAERIREENSPTQEIDTNSSKEVKDKNTVSETQRGNVQGSKETRERNGGGLTFPQAKTNGQVDERETQKHSEKANDQQQQGKDLSIEKENDGKISSDARFSEIQERLRGGNSASTVAPTTENNSGDVSVRSKSDSSDTGVKGAADENVREGSREDEDLTELLWAEWSRRQVAEEPQPSSTPFNFAEVGQYVFQKVAAFTALQKAIGVFTIWSFFMVLAYRLGRARVSSRKDIPTSKEAPIDYLDNLDLPIVSSSIKARRDMKRGPAFLSEGFDFFQDSVNAMISRLKEFASKDKRVIDASKREENNEAGVSPGERQSSRESDPPENRKWWRTPLGDDLLSETKETSVSDRGNKKLSGQFVPGDVRQDLNYLSHPSKNGTRSDSTSSEGSRSHVNNPINLEMKQLQGHRGREETSRGPRTPRYPSWVSLHSADSKGTELQAAGDQPRQRGSQRPSQAEWRNPEVRDTDEKREQEELSTSDGSFVSTMPKSPIRDSWKGKNLDHRNGTSPTGDLHSARKTGTGRITSSGKIPMKPQTPVDDFWVKESSIKFDSYEHVKQKDSPEVVNPKQGSREVEGSAASQSEARLNSFVHDHVLWVRDDDGIFVRQAAAMEEGDGSNVTSLLRGEQDMPESTLSFDAERNSRKGERNNLTSSMAPMEQRKAPGRGFDYRQLVIDSRDQYLPTDQQGFATENQPDTLRQQMWPLRYGSGKQKVS